MKHDDSGRNHLELVTIYEVSKILGRSLDLQRALHDVLNLLASHLQIRRGMVSLLSDGELRIVAVTGLSKEEQARGLFKSGEGITGRILKDGMPMVIPDISQEPLYLNRTGARPSSGVVSYIGVPIKAGNEVLGVLSIDRLEGVKPQPHFGADVRFLTMISHLIGQTVRLHRLINSAQEELRAENRRLEKELQGRYTIENVVGQSKRMQEVFSQVHMAAPGRSTVLLRGESGTGKEMIARAIHYLSSRKDGPFVKINCAALPESLLESELFGHEKGAFTGATQERKGRFELAHGGTLFLDEIGEISPSFQAKLLRVLQEREFERVGGSRTIKVDVRLITATNRNLEDAVSKNEFRADLYYRINVISIFLPPLRDRREDIPYLVEHFLSRLGRDFGRRLRLTPDAMQVLASCNWPGNVRELENCVERAATMARGNMIRSDDLLCHKEQCLSTMLWRLQDQGAKVIPIQARPAASVPASKAPPATVMPPVTPSVPSAPLDEAEDLLDDLGGASAFTSDAPLNQRERLVKAMEQCGWVQAKAARLLGLTPRQIGYALKKYGVEVKRL